MNIIRRIAFYPMLIALFALTACDSATGPEGSTTIRGQVTDDSGFGKTSAAIEGAVVTASSVSASGQLTQLEGRATTDAQGRFALSVDEASDVVIVAAEKAAFRSKALVYTTGSATTNAMPMTTESKAEANVYVEAKQQDASDDEDDVTVADVAAYVSTSVAAEIEAGRTTAAQVATAIRAAAEAEMQYARQEEDDNAIEEEQQNERQAFVRLQADLSASGNASSETAAIQAFQEAMIQAYTSANISAETQARARHAGRAALIRFSATTNSAARFGMRQQAEILTAMATAEAVEASFRASGSSQARLSALAQARSTLIAKLRAASSANAVESAQSEYQSRVEAELASELNVEASVLSSARAGMGIAKAALDLAVNTAGSASAVATAHSAFFTSAEASGRSSLNGSQKAEVGATVLALLVAGA